MGSSGVDDDNILDEYTSEDEDDILDEPSPKQATQKSKSQPQQPQPQQQQQEADVSHDTSNNDILGSLADLGLRFFLVLIVAMLDCIEQTFASMSYASGKNFKWVLLIVFTYIPVSVLSPLFGYRSCITWQDAVIAFIVTLALYAVNGINKATINGAVSKIKEASGKVIKGGKQIVAKRK